MDEPTIRCRKFLDEEGKIKEITDEINRAKTYDEKAEKAQELMNEVEKLLSCEEYDKKKFDCINCHRISKVRKDTANLFIKPEETTEERGKGLDEFQSSIGAIFHGLGGFIGLISQMMEKDMNEISRTGEIKGLEKVGARGIYGFTIRTGIGRRPRIDGFGNIRETEKGITIEESREPMVDVFDEKDTINIVAEIPGVSEEEIKTEIRGDILIITAESGDRKYHKEVLLPSTVDPKTLKSNYKNGVLELKLRKIKK